MASGTDSGRLLKPLVIFPGSRLPANVATSEFISSIYSANRSGWTRKETFLDWCEKVLPLEFPDLSHHNQILVLTDGHKSRISHDVVDSCMRRGINLYLLPPHTTHFLSPLDKTCFSPLHTSYRKAVRKSLSMEGFVVERELISLLTLPIDIRFPMASLFSTFIG